MILSLRRLALKMENVGNGKWLGLGLGGTTMTVRVFTCDFDELSVTLTALSSKKYTILRWHKSLLTGQWKISAIPAKVVNSWPEHKAFRRLDKLSTSVFARK
jgi:hypothetical protein